MAMVQTLTKDAQCEKEALLRTNQKLHADALKTEAQNLELEALIIRQEKHLQSLQEFYDKSKAERSAIQQERTRILSEAVSS